MRIMPERFKANQVGGLNTVRSRPVILACSLWPLGISAAVSVVVTLALVCAFSTTRHRLATAQELGLRGTISDTR